MVRGRHKLLVTRRVAEIEPVEHGLDEVAYDRVRGPPELLARQLAELLQGQAAAKSGDCAAVR